MGTKKLYRSEAEKMLGGVCAGLGHYLDIDPTLVRLAFVLIGIVAPQSVVVYLILWLVIPVDPTGIMPPPPTPPSDPQI